MWNSCIFLQEIIPHRKNMENKYIAFQNASNFDVRYMEPKFFLLSISSTLQKREFHKYFLFQEKCETITSFDFITFVQQYTSTQHWKKSLKEFYYTYRLNNQGFPQWGDSPTTQKIGLSPHCFTPKMLVLQFSCSFCHFVQIFPPHKSTPFGKPHLSAPFDISYSNKT